MQSIKERLKQADETTEEWSIPWLLVGFIVMLGYCAYYVMQWVTPPTKIIVIIIIIVILESNT